MFEVKGMSLSIHVNSGIKFVEVADYALSCKVSRN